MKVTRGKSGVNKVAYIESIGRNSMSSEASNPMSLLKKIVPAVNAITIFAIEQMSKNKTELTSLKPKTLNARAVGKINPSLFEWCESREKSPFASLKAALL